MMLHASRFVDWRHPVSRKSDRQTFPPFSFSGSRRCRPTDELSDFGRERYGDLAVATTSDLGHRCHDTDGSDG